MQCARGFTLIEVLVALIIVALAAAASMEAVSGAADTVTVLRERSFAQWIALNRITEQRVAASPPADGDSDGVVDYAGRRWEWHQKIERLALAGLRRIDVSVRLAQEAGATSTVAGGEKSYLVTASSVLGTAIAAPRGYTPDWEPAGAPPGAANPNAPLAPSPPATGT
jgi:general secretion pathway protein I